MPLVEIDGSQLATWDSFHKTFAAVFGFPAYYGRNMDAWIDCMSSLDRPGDRMSTIHCEPPDVVTILIVNVEEVPRDIWFTMLESAAFVNGRRAEFGEPCVLAISGCRLT